LKKLHLIGKDLYEFSLDTVKMFYNDACAAGYSIKTKAAHKTPSLTAAKD
jgi:transaldolase